MTYIRPLRKYSTAWDCHIRDQISRLVMVQRRAVRYTVGDFHPMHSITQMLIWLSWQTLYERQAHLKITMLYRIIHGLIAIPPEPPYIYPATRSSGRRPTQFRQQRCKTTSFQESFFPSAVCLWNRLPTSVASASSPESFRRQLVGMTLRPHLEEKRWFLLAR